MTASPPSDRTASDNVIKAMRIMRKRQKMSAQKLSDLLVARGQLVSRTVLTSQETGRIEKISIDQVVALADIFGVAIESLLRPACDTCQNLPPAGFTCNECGETG